MTPEALAAAMERIEVAFDSIVATLLAAATHPDQGATP